MAETARKVKREQFRAAYHSGANVEVIPSKKDLGIEDEERPELVAPYCRVSTLAESQTESYELQKAYYEDYVGKHALWTLVDVYADEGISATSMRNRKDFLRLIEDCKAGKITRIITKSVSRFARNVVDCLSTVRMLRALPQAVGVYFETEHIDSLSRDCDSQLSLIASFAESESLNKSTSMKWAIRGRFANGIPRISDLYGYCRNKAQLMIDPITGPVVYQIYRWYAACFTLREISQALHAREVPSPEGNEYWSTATIFYILTNERYCGDVLMQKTVCIDIFSHKSVKNTGHERQYILREHHPAIVDEALRERVQFRLGKMDLSAYFVEEAAPIEIKGQKFKLLDPKKGA